MELNRRFVANPHRRAVYRDRAQLLFRWPRLVYQWYQGRKAEPDLPLVPPSVQAAAPSGTPHSSKAIAAVPSLPSKPPTTLSTRQARWNACRTHALSHLPALNSPAAMHAWLTQRTTSMPPQLHVWRQRALDSWGYAPSTLTTVSHPFRTSSCGWRPMTSVAMTQQSQRRVAAFRQTLRQTGAAFNPFLVVRRSMATMAAAAVVGPRVARALSRGSGALANRL